ncbi:response regulator [Kiritimatiella glycovorans]|uniref:Gliding motility regulatory protein n=1 Tax=Kiritimatiella glycovorans TaxID=1307763 RepID=A0A0G3EES2_9BACT|nr:response regulator [Kiritimatiella glycovorans]AKJ63882.1 Gliding motility regulatory protein [Kiritimatiella glycovorans]
MERPKRVLIVEDERPVQQLLSKLLRRMNLEYDLAGNGEEAMKKLDSSPGLYRIMIVDLLLPKLTGWDLLDYVRQNPLFEQMKTIILTGANTSEQETEKLSGSCDAVVQKGEFTIESFEQTLRGLMAD